MDFGVFDFGALDLGALLPFILIGFAAQLVDGAVGMAFGVIMNTLLVGVLGVPPAIASKRVHVVECFTTLASATSHLLHRNIDGKLFARLLIPGMIVKRPGSRWRACAIRSRPLARPSNLYSVIR